VSQQFSATLYSAERPSLSFIPTPADRNRWNKFGLPQLQRCLGSWKSVSFTFFFMYNRQRIYCVVCAGCMLRGCPWLFADSSARPFPLHRCIINNWLHSDASSYYGFDPFLCGTNLVRWTVKRILVPPKLLKGGRGRPGKETLREDFFFAFFCVPDTRLLLRLT